MGGTSDTPAVEESLDDLFFSIQMATEAADEAEALVESGANRAMRIKILYKRLEDGASLAEKLAQHPDATAEQIRIARIAKLTFLYRGTMYNEERFEPKLREYARHLEATAPKSEGAAIAAGVLIETRYFSRQASFSQMLTVLGDYARKFPNSTAGIKLFYLYAEKLELRGDIGRAVEVYELALKEFTDKQALKPFEKRVKKLRDSKALNGLSSRR